jgi:hypothetical protein
MVNDGFSSEMIVSNPEIEKKSKHTQSKQEQHINHKNGEANQYIIWRETKTTDTNLQLWKKSNSN